jgi:hypothetical protein
VTKEANPQHLTIPPNLILLVYSPTGSLLLVGIEVKSLSTQQPLKQPL